MAEQETAFKNIDHKNKTVSRPRPDRINDIDTKGSLYDNIIYSSDNNTLDLNSLASLTNVSQSRDEIYNMLDVMCEDPIIASAVNIYTSDICEPSDSGHIVWAESDNVNALNCVQHLLDQLNVDKNIFNWAHALVKYGDIYLRLYRNSEYNDNFELVEDEDNKTLNEDVVVKAYAKDDHYAEYIEMHRNPAELFELQRFGKTIGFIKTHIQEKNVTGDVTTALYNQFKYNFNRNDIDVYPATDFVHAYLPDNSSRLIEEVSISNVNDEDENEVVYNVKRGKSILYNVFRIWRELSLLENSVMLNRITRSSVIRTVSIETGDMEKADVRALMQRVKSMVEQKSAISVNSSYDNYTNPGPMENTIYVPTQDGKGVITTGQIGGEAESDDLKDLQYFKNKLFAGLGIPGAYLGEGDSADGSLFNNGNSLALKSSQYAKTVKHMQNAICQALTDAMNLILLDKGLTQYINEFTIRMQAPTTQEEKDRKDNLATSINNVRDILGLLDGIENPASKLKITKCLLAPIINNEDVITAIQDEIDSMEAGAAETGGDIGGDEFGDFGGDAGGPPVDMGGGEEIGGGEISSEPMEMPAEEPAEAEPPEESFLTPKGGQVLNERDNLPSWHDMGLSYTDV